MNPLSWPLRVRLLAALSAGLALTAAFPPLDQSWVAILALVPLFLALRGASARAGALIGLVFGLGFFAVLLYWISYFGYAAWAALSLAMAAYMVILGVLGGRASRTPIGRILGIPLLWAGLEMARSRWPLGSFPWGVLGNSQHDGGTLLPLARIGGVTVVGLAIAVIAGLLAEAIVSRARAAAAFIFGAAVLVVLPGLLPLGIADRSTGTLDVAAIQGNVPRDRFTSLGRRGRVGPEDFTIVQNHLTVTQQLIGATAPDLIVWPENSFDRDPRLNAELYDPVVATLAHIGAPLLAGAILDAGERWYNANILIEPNGVISQRYDKVHLVPFGEYVPFHLFRSLVPALDRELPVDGIAGRRLVVFQVGAARVGTLICFESIYPELARSLVRNGAQVLIVTTNDASFGTSPASRQHLAASQLRAVELGRTVVQSAISGISAVIQPGGTITAERGLFRAALLRARLPLATGQTPYARYGSAIEVTVGAGALVFTILPFVRRRKEAA